MGGGRKGGEREEGRQEGQGRTKGTGRKEAWTMEEGVMEEGGRGCRREEG